LLPWLESGNLTEEYALPLIFGALYCLLSYFDDSFSLNRIQVFLSGVFMGGVLMLRPNMIGLWVGMCAVIFFHTLIIRKFKLILRYIVFFALGNVAAIAPFILWLGLKGSLYDFYECYIRFNVMNTERMMDRLSSGFLVFLYYPAVTAAAVILVVRLCLKKRGLKDSGYVLACGLFAALAASVALAAFSGRVFPHYYMVLVPCLVLPIAWVIDYAMSWSKTEPLLVYALTALVLFGQLNIVGSLESGRRMLFNTIQEDAYTMSMASIIQDNTSPDDTIAVLGNRCNLYLFSDRDPAFRFVYFPGEMSPPYTYEYYFFGYRNTDAFRGEPELVVQSIFDLPWSIVSHLDEHYSVIYEGAGTVVHKRLADG